MIKKTITFPDFDGNMLTEDFYFNLTQADIVKLQLSTKEGFGEMLDRITKEQDGAKLIEQMQNLILMSVGQKSADGRRFTKNDEIREDFASTEAYSKLFIELATNTPAAVEFINGIIPKDLDKIKMVPMPEDKQLEGQDGVKPKKFEDFSRQELLDMSQSDFIALVGTDPKAMTEEQLAVAMQRRNSAE